MVLLQFDEVLEGGDGSRNIGNFVVFLVIFVLKSENFKLNITRKEWAEVLSKNGSFNQPFEMEKWSSRKRTRSEEKFGWLPMHFIDTRIIEIQENCVNIYKNKNVIIHLFWMIYSSNSNDKNYELFFFSMVKYIIFLLYL